MPSLPFSIRERVRWSDCDPLGIIFYGSYLRLFEIAEHELLRAAGLPFDVLRVERGIWLPRKALSMEFHEPARMDEELMLGAGVVQVGSTSITFRFEAARVADGRRCASASLTVVCVEKATLAKFPIPEWVRTALAPFVLPAGSA